MTANKKGNLSKMRKNTHGMCEYACARTNAGGHFGRVGNTKEHPQYGISKWPSNVICLEFYPDD